MRFLPLIFDSAGGVEKIEIGRDRRAENRNSAKPVMRRVVVRKRRYSTLDYLPPGRIDDPRSHDEANGDQPKHRHTLFDHSKRAFPDHEPDNERNRNGPPRKANARGEFESNADTTDLSGEYQQTHYREHQEEKRKIVEAEAFSNRIGNRAAAHGGEPARLFDEKDD